MGRTGLGGLGSVKAGRGWSGSRNVRYSEAVGYARMSGHSGAPNLWIHRAVLWTNVHFMDEVHFVDKKCRLWTKSVFLWTNASFMDKSATFTVLWKIQVNTWEEKYQPRSCSMHLHLQQMHQAQLQLPQHPLLQHHVLQNEQRLSPLYA